MFVRLPFVLKDHVLDVATGTGQIAFPLAQEGYNVTGIDISEGQLEVARSRLENLSKNVNTGGESKMGSVEFRVGSDVETGMEDNSVSLVTVAQAAHWFNLPHFFTVWYIVIFNLVWFVFLSWRDPGFCTLSNSMYSHLNPDTQPSIFCSFYSGILSCVKAQRHVGVDGLFYHENPRPQGTGCV